MTEAEQVMKRCQIGTRDYNEANNLHADCYRVIGKLLAQRTEQEPVRAPWSQALESVWAEQEPAAKYSDIVSDGGLDPRNKFDIPPQRTEQEPVAIKRMKEWVEYLKRKSDFGQHMNIPSEMSAGTCWELALELEQFINTTPSQQEPVIDKSAAIRIATSLGWTPQRKPLTHEQRFDVLTKFEPHKHEWHAPAILIDLVEAAHGIKENT